MQRFKAPDVRDRSSLTFDTEPAKPSYPQCWVLQPGVNYRGVCPNSLCTSYERGYTICQMGFGEFRPNEQRCRGEIVCPACATAFWPHCFIFSHCSSQIEYCFPGKSLTKISLSEDRPKKACQLGRFGKVVTYEMLLIEVDRPGIFPDDGTLRTPEESKSQVPSDTEAPSECDSGGASDYESEAPDDEPEEEEWLYPDAMSPEDIHFIQASIGSYFQCGRSIRRTMKKLRSGDLCASDIPTISVFWWNDRWYTADNRRLWCFQKAGLSSVPVKHIDVSEVDAGKFTTRNNGESVVVRQDH